MAASRRVDSSLVARARSPLEHGPLLQPRRPLALQLGEARRGAGVGALAQLLGQAVSLALRRREICEDLLGSPIAEPAIELAAGLELPEVEVALRARVVQLLLERGGLVA